MTESTPMKKSGTTRVGVVGAGFIADFHLEVLAQTPGAQVVAICDTNERRAEETARQWSVAHTTDAIAELPALGVDVVHLLTPPTTHAALTRECLEAGMGVFVEKPLALESGEARELGELADEKDLPLCVNHNAVHHPSFAPLLKRVKAGEIGQIEHVQVTLSVPLRQLDAHDYSHWMFQTPRNIVFEQGPHPFAQITELAGAVKECETSVLSTRELNPGQVFHDRWMISGVAERGCTVECYFAFGMGFTRSTIQVLGSDGSLQADLFHNLLFAETKSPWLDFWNSFLAGWKSGGALRRDALRGLGGYLTQTLGIAGRSDAFYVGMRDSIRAFHGAVRMGAAMPAGPERGAQVLEWCEAATAGIAEGPAAPAVTGTTEPARPGEILVLGASGFIGRPTVAALLEADRPVTALVRSTACLPPVLVEGAASGRVRIVEGDLNDADSLGRAVTGIETVIHLATGGGDTWAEVERAMVRGSESLARAAHAAGVKRFIYVSSVAALYLGHDAKSRLIEDDEPLDPQPDARPVYARGKMAAEEALLALHREEGLGLVIVRPGVVLGTDTPMQHSGIGLWVRDNHCVGWGLGDNHLPLVWVDDVADALCAAASHEGNGLHGHTLNLCARVPLSGQEVVARLRETTGRDLHFHPRSLAVSQAMEIGKWVVKVVGRKKAPFPSWRDLKSRALVPPFSSRTARETLGWEPCEDADEFMARITGQPPA